MSTAPYFPVTNNGRQDHRYQIRKEFCGHEKAQFVLRFCGEFIASSAFYSPMAVRAVGHNAQRLGAAIIEAKGEKP